MKHSLACCFVLQNTFVFVHKLILLKQRMLENGYWLAGPFVLFFETFQCTVFLIFL